MDTFGGRLRDAIICAGESVASVATALDVSEQTVRNWKRMKEATLHGKQLARLGIFLKTSIIWLALGIGSPTPNGMLEERKARFAEVK